MAKNEWLWHIQIENFNLQEGRLRGMGALPSDEKLRVMDLQEEKKSGVSEGFYARSPRNDLVQ